MYERKYANIVAALATSAGKEIYSITLDSLETAKEMQPLYSSGFFLTRASMSEAAAVTTPIW